MSEEQSPMTPEYGLPAPPPLVVKPNPEEAPRLSTFQRISSAFVAPSEAFEDVNRKPSPWAPLLLLGVMALVFGILFSFLIKVDKREIARTAIEKQFERQGKRMSDLTEAERQAVEKNIDVSVAIQKAIPYAGAVLAPIAITCLAGIFFVGTLLVRGQTSFAKVLSVTAYANLVCGFVGYVLTALIVVLKPPDIDALLEGNLAMSNLGLLASKDTPKWISVLLSQFDFFTIWFLVLMTIGLAAVCYKKRPSQMAIIPFGLWFLWVLVRVAFAMILNA